MRSGEGHIVPDSVLISVWAALLALTAVTVGVSLVDLKHITIFTAVIIATVKATLVVLYFMHMRYERPLYWWMLSAALGFYGIAIGLTFVDYSFR